MIRVLVVDDSAVMRAFLGRVVASQPDMELLGASPDPLLAIDRIRRTPPDVITLDVEMPRMNGLDFLRVEGIRVLAQDLLDVCPRKVHFFLDSGKVHVKRLGLTPSEPVQRREREYLKRLGSERGGEVEIFSPPR